MKKKNNPEIIILLMLLIALAGTVFLRVKQNNVTIKSNINEPAAEVSVADSENDYILQSEEHAMSDSDNQTDSDNQSDSNNQSDVVPTATENTTSAENLSETSNPEEQNPELNEESTATDETEDNDATDVTSEQSEVESDLPNIDITSWEYVLVNAENSIENYTPELTTLEGNQKFDSRAVEALQTFIDAARAEGLSVYLSSSYRSYDEQNYLYQRKVSQYGGDTATAAKIVAPPGTSEHQTGLCCDITDRYYELKNSTLENTELFKWMSAHCAEYGFIVRYPKDKEDVTGIIYEPWHFRYVGVEAASYITEHGLCLEEFVALYQDGQ